MEQTTNSQFDFNAIIEKARFVLTDPKGCWGKIKAEQTDIKGVYVPYVVVLSAIPVVCGFIGMMVFGILGFRPSFIGQLVSSILQYGLGFVGIFIGAHIFKFLAPKFGGNDDLLSAIKLLAYAYTASWVGGALGIFPPLLILGLLFALYSLYTLYQGITPMLGVPESSRIPFFAVSIIVGIVLTFLIAMIVGIVTPKPPTLSAETQQQLELFQQQMQNLGK